MSTLCLVFFSSLRSSFRSRAALQAEILALRHQLFVFWQALTIAGIVGFGTTVGVHPAIGYLSATHLGPAVVGCVTFATGLGLAAHGSVPGFARKWGDRGFE